MCVWGVQGAAPLQIQGAAHLSAAERERGRGGYMRGQTQGVGEGRYGRGRRVHATIYYAHTLTGPVPPLLSPYALPPPPRLVPPFPSPLPPLSLHGPTCPLAHAAAPKTPLSTSTLPQCGIAAAALAARLVSREPLPAAAIAVAAAARAAMEPAEG